MKKLPCEGCKGMCCGPVPITKKELKEIKKKVKSMSSKERNQLEAQTRFYGTCIFYDLDNDQCGIYSARPEICRVFGYHINLSCFRKPEIAIKDNWKSNEIHIGILSQDFTWKDFN